MATVRSVGRAIVEGSATGVVLWAAAGFVLVFPGRHRAIAQAIPDGATPPVVLPPDAESRPFPIEQPRDTPPLPVEVPAEPSPPVLDPSLGGPASDPAVPLVRFRVDEIIVTGNSILHDEIAEAIQCCVNRDVTFEELVALRSAITQLYIDRGFVTSGAFLPNNQDVRSGVVEIRVVEGELEDAIQITGLQRLNPSYVRSRLRLAGKKPLNQRDLERALQLLQIDPQIESVDAELTAGSVPGRSLLAVNLQEASPFSANIGADNYQSSSIGSAQFSVSASYSNLLGAGDRLFASYGRTDGLNLYNLGISLPVNPRDGTITLSYNTNDSRIIEDAFEDFDIRSEAETWSLQFRQPLSRSVNQEFALGVGLDLRRSQTFILGDRPFSFSRGTENGESRVTALRFFQDWVERDRLSVLAARSEFSVGLDAFGATVNDSGTDGLFVKWLGQFQWVRRFSGRSLFLARLNAQLTPDSLLSVERIGLGGFDTVRGYAQNQIVADNALWGSLEARFPLLRNSNRLTLISFLDAGHAWNIDLDDPEDDFLLGVGAGLRWEALPNLVVGLDYGLPLIDAQSQGDSLQDNGFYLSVRYFPF
ncbi:ShlB/FhaC/HecB family hemolysin secretion/activation protein [Thermoleptolyngbya oregonensis NK1-22]|uniref:ShlB/FhaC/HecB family hemolysin secretion/activation protein n=1 Tax=Thermoleptolyngbya oregonensis NK1-22 TaxID=2547457 RepID=A0AA96Y5T7_9CYAN|nr:ShlB/FhaC/HecB family hemolysin secretion/activation protein [Thermoleptolyngbya oregonensis]WOB44746.1 ShlB/FhaC/HecB family hemolysin secretion/activation protein [Thermoleptolyngbya oregonensis NK1-22]